MADVRDILPILSSRVFMVSGLIFKSLIHFEFIFVYGGLFFLIKTFTLTHS